MRRLVALFAAVMSVVAGYSQSGSEGLGAMAQKMGAMGSYRIDFELEMPSATAASKGYCIVSGERYVIAIEDMKQGSDGSVVWAVNAINQEITLDNPRPQSRSLFDNPTKAFDFAEGLFEVVGFDAESADVWGIVLRPAEGVLDGIDSVALEVSRKTNLPTAIGYTTAGMGLLVRITKIAPATPSEEEFVIPQIEGYEVIDFR